MLKNLRGCQGEFESRLTLLDYSRMELHNIAVRSSSNKSLAVQHREGDTARFVLYIEASKGSIVNDAQGYGGHVASAC